MEIQTQFMKTGNLIFSRFLVVYQDRCLTKSGTQSIPLWLSQLRDDPVSRRPRFESECSVGTCSHCNQCKDECVVFTANIERKQQTTDGNASASQHRRPGGHPEQCAIQPHPNNRRSAFTPCCNTLFNPTNRCSAQRNPFSVRCPFLARQSEISGISQCIAFDGRKFWWTATTFGCWWFMPSSTLKWFTSSTWSTKN